MEVKVWFKESLRHFKVLYGIFIWLLVGSFNFSLDIILWSHLISTFCEVERRPLSFVVPCPRPYWVFGSARRSKLIVWILNDNQIWGYRQHALTRLSNSVYFLAESESWIKSELKIWLWSRGNYVTREKYIMPR